MRREAEGMWEGRMEKGRIWRTVKRFTRYDYNQRYSSALSLSYSDSNSHSLVCMPALLLPDRTLPLYFPQQRYMSSTQLLGQCCSGSGSERERVCEREREV